MTRPRSLPTLLLLLGCGDAREEIPAPAPEPSVPRSAAADLDGRWRATLQSPGGELPFELDIEGDAATVINGPERVPFSSVAVEGAQVKLRMDVYDSEIVATIGDDGALAGTWTKTAPKGPSTMPFAATRGDRPRFDGELPPPEGPVPDSIDGNWKIRFTEEDGSTFAGQGIFETRGDALLGTVLTDTGDYRYLAGRYARGQLELSCFDGAHAFLLRAVATGPDRLAGSFWSRAQYHAEWAAQRMQFGDESPLADPYAVLTARGGRFEFSFPDLEGNVVSDKDPRFTGKVVLAEIFGTWCPNCNDYAPLLAKWHARYHARGLEIVGLAFEMTGDAARDREYVAKFAAHHELAFPLLLAGTSDKTEAATALPSLDRIASFPTTVFVGRDGKVHKIHSGFAGPATGEHHDELVAELEAEIEALLAAG